MRRLLVRKKKFFFIGGLLALLIVAGATLVSRLQPQEASATSSKNVNLVINGSGAESYFSMDNRRAWCITPKWVNPDSGNHTATVYDLSEFKNATSGQMLRIKRMFTAYYWASNNIHGEIDGQTNGLHSVTNNDAMHWALAYLYEGYDEYPSDGTNAKAIFDFYKKGLPNNLATGYVEIIPDGYRGDGAHAQAIFTADYTVKTTDTQKVVIKKVWKDSIGDPDFHNVSIEFNLKDAATGQTVEHDFLNAQNNWTKTYTYEVESGSTPRTFKIEEVIPDGQNGFEIVQPQGEDRWHNTNIDTANGGNVIYYFMPQEVSCGTSNDHLTNNCTLVNRSEDITKVNLWTTKHWNDGGYAGDYRPESLNYTIHALIYRNNAYEQVDDMVEKAGVTFVKIGDANSIEWGGYVSGLVTKLTVDGTEYDLTYAIEEKSVPAAYSLSCAEDVVVGNKTYCKAVANDDGDYEVDWTNSLEKITVTATKHWNDGGNVAKRPYAVAFNIYRSVNGGTPEYYRTSYMVKSWYGTGEEWSLSLSLVKKDTEGNEYNYTYKEIDYYNGGSDTHVSDNYIIDGQTIGFAPATNTGMTNTAKTSIPVKKCFIDEDKTKRPKSLDFELSNDKDGEVQNLILTAANEDEDGCWTGKFKDLPAYDENGEAITYTVEEDDSLLVGYALDEDFSTCEINAGDNFAADDDEKDGCVFYNVQLVDIPVKKVWAEDKKEDRPGSIEVSLMCGDDVLDTVKLSEENNLDGDNTWEYTWKNRRVDECDKGYSVAENIDIPGYATKITGNAEDGFVITNTKTLDEILTWGSLGAGSFGAIAAGFFIVKRKLFDR